MSTKLSRMTPLCLLAILFSGACSTASSSLSDAEDRRDATALADDAVADSADGAHDDAGQSDLQAADGAGDGPASDGLAVNPLPWRGGLLAFGGAGQHTPTALAVDKQGRVILGGRTHAGTRFQIGQHGFTAQGEDGWVVMLTPGGAVDWLRPASSTGFAMVNDVVSRGSYIFVLGQFDGTLTLGQSQLKSIVGHQRDLFVARLTDDGRVDWLRRYGGTAAEFPRRLAVDAQGNVYVAATLWESTTIDGKQHINSDAPRKQMLLIKLNATGAVLWSQSYGGAADDEIARIVIDTDGLTPHFCGTFGGTVSFGAQSFKSAGHVDVFCLTVAPQTGAIVAAAVIAGPGPQYVGDLAVAGSELLVGVHAGTLAELAPGVTVQAVPKSTAAAIVRYRPGWKLAGHQPLLSPGAVSWPLVAFGSGTEVVASHFLGQLSWRKQSVLGSSTAYRPFLGTHSSAQTTLVAFSADDPAFVHELGVRPGGAPALVGTFEKTLALSSAATPISRSAFGMLWLYAP
ncbi:MAG: hypothetical protein H6707_09220 [Deltaproteobacteria bacterium]|nr:hypothetical protein [Deltaproteobacteria bacterium]